MMEEIADPFPGRGEVRIIVHACGINFPDYLLTQDRYQFKPARPFAPGSEVAGVIDLVGPDCAFLRPGDRVNGLVSAGGLAERVIVAEEACFTIPDQMSMAEAAAFLMTYGTSYYALQRQAMLQPGEKLLVLGAAGGVGIAAVELGRAAGAVVFGGVSSDEKAALATAHGAHATLVYPRDIPDAAAGKALTNQIRSTVSGEVNVVYDAVGGAYSAPSFRALAWAGRFLVVGFPAGIAQIPLNLPLLKGASIIGIYWGASIRRDPKEHRKNVANLFALYEQGALRPSVARRFPFAEGGAAIAHLASRQALGKTVVLVKD